MADDRGEQAGPVDVGARLADASGKGRDRHTDICGHHLGAWTQAPRRPIGVVAGLPELAAVLLALGPGELPSPLVARDLGEGLDLLARGGGAAVKLEKQRRLLGKREMRIGVAGPDLHLVGELDAGEREFHLHGDDGGVAGALEGGEGADRGENGLGDTVQLQRELGDDAERALGADQEMGQIVTVCRFPGALPGIEQRAVGQHRVKAQDVVAHGAVTHGVGARGASRRHAAEARIGAWVDGEEKALVA